MWPVRLHNWLCLWVEKALAAASFWIRRIEACEQKQGRKWKEIQDKESEKGKSTKREKSQSTQAEESEIIYGGEEDEE